MRLIVIVLVLAVSCSESKESAQAPPSNPSAETAVGSASVMSTVSPEAPPVNMDDSIHDTAMGATAADTAMRRAGMEPAPSMRERAATARGRAAHVASLPEDQRAQLRMLRVMRAEGRRLGRAGQHQAALSAFELAIAMAPRDPTLLCEAGYQAFKLSDYAKATKHLMRGLRGASPRTRGACLYNMARVHEEEENIPAAVDYLKRSVAARPNRTASRRLAGLERQLAAQREDGEESEAWEWNDPDAVDTSRFESMAPRSSKEQVCEDFGCRLSGDCFDMGERGVEAFREVCIAVFPGEMFEYGHLLVRGDAGWRIGEQVTETDTGDTYGSIEIAQSAAFSIEGNTFVMTVRSSGDEAEGEAEAYFACEEEHANDADAVEACFLRRVPDTEIPSWSEEQRFRIPSELPTPFQELAD